MSHSFRVCFKCQSRPSLANQILDPYLKAFLGTIWFALCVFVHHSSWFLLMLVRNLANGLLFIFRQRSLVTYLVIFSFSKFFDHHLQLVAYFLAANFLIAYMSLSFSNMFLDDLCALLVVNFC